MNTFQLVINHNGTGQIPVLKDSITWETTRQGTPGKLEFTCIKTDGLDFQEGDAVLFTVDGVNVFHGFVFTKSRNKEQHIKVTCYDQLRYFKNKDSCAYENKTASELLQMLCDDFRLQTGTIEDTRFKIESRVEKDKTLFDMIQNALDVTIMNTGRMYVLYDDAGKLCLRDIESMMLPLLLAEANAEDYDYSSSIDGETYNKIKLVYENEDTKKLEGYVAQSGEAMNQWGILQYYETQNNDINLKSKADALLSLYCQKTRNLTVKGIFGDIRARAGASIAVSLALGDIITANYMVIENAKHKISKGIYTMDLTLIGGEFIA